jgi:hypothetical protein
MSSILIVIEIITVYTESHTTPVSVLCEKNTRSQVMLKKLVRILTTVLGRVKHSFILQG